MRRSLTVLIALTTVMAALGASPASARPESLRVGVSLAEAVANLPVVPPIDNGYAEATFAIPPVTRRDSRGCDKRKRVLLASAKVTPRIGPNCTLSGGTWLVDNGTRSVRGSSRIDVVPLVSAKTAWNQGAFGWSNEQRRSFLTWYQKPARECAVDSAGKSGNRCGYVLQTNAGLTAQTTDVTTQRDWKATCDQAKAVTHILGSWGLSVAPAAAKVLQATAPKCKGSLRVDPLNTVNPIPPTGGGNPFLAPGTAATTWLPTDVLNAPPGPSIPASLFGLHVPVFNGPAPQVEYAWLRLWDAKTGWEPLEQTQGTFYWKSLDDAVSFAEASGKKVAYVFGDTPPWAGPSAAYPPSEINEYRTYVQAVVSRYGNRIAAYEVWNEPNLFVKESDALADLVEMTQIVHDTVQSAGVSSLVQTPSTTMRTGTAVYPYFSKYLVKLAERGWPIDGFTVHTYPRASGGPEQRVQSIALFKELLALAKAPALPIWDTEINYGLGGLQEPRRAIEGPDAQGYLAQTFIDAVRLGVTQVDWYLWFAQYYSVLGIQLNPETPDTIAAWRWVHDQLSGASLTACSQAGDAVICGFTKAGTKYALAYSSTGVPASIRVPSHVKQACGIDGACQAISGGTLRVGILPLRLSQ